MMSLSDPVFHSLWNLTRPMDGAAVGSGITFPPASRLLSVSPSLAPG